MSELAVISSNSRVVMHFSIKLEDGSAADSSKVHGKPARFQMGDGNLTANFEKHLLGLKAGDEREFTLEPEEAFGQPIAENIYQVDLTKFSSDTPAEVGAIIAFTQPDGREVPGIVRKIEGNQVTIDFNHPLAGQRIVFAVEILSVEDA
ncbi:FKBP-type peptidyl-prolyl cis-trans isomerase [Aliidiomarina maris]|uniref:Peptidyl-prolyl cis-trans isomerase n=1 Tax=Aliidiomarina maris TaxID=531312 RepID=A0A327X6L8_9GAMM|nr:FKBP-type peptidyl-prolyl cis-trans isomerase [Aliidiomarina maris]MBA3989225.1 peptidylprolyl isomerase [Idiomarina sp.]RAK00753.1 FKBP-type peptidyl-prolyl cis-trans isomerase SlpA [Aliidiomarina maris]RUO27249.1 peptidylprolyl isomerase [Aliidiomarina maris]